MLAATLSCACPAHLFHFQYTLIRETQAPCLHIPTIFIPIRSILVFPLPFSETHTRSAFFQLTIIYVSTSAMQGNIPHGKFSMLPLRQLILLTQSMDHGMMLILL